MGNKYKEYEIIINSSEKWGKKIGIFSRQKKIEEKPNKEKES